MNTLLSIDRELAQQLVECATHKRSGIATATRNKLRRLFCMREGRLVYAASNVIEEQISEVLVERGLLSPASLIQASSAAAQRSIPITAAIVETGEVDARTLQEAAADHVRDLLFDTLRWSEGECAFEPGIPDLESETTVDLDCVPLIVEFAREHTDGGGELQMRIGPPSSRPRLRKEREAVLDAFEADGAMRLVLEQSDGLKTASEIASSAETADAAWRAIYALLLVGALEIETRTAAEARDGMTITRAEVLARLERSAGADAYGVLELNPNCRDDELRGAYYFLARRYHPDRFRAGEMQDLLPQIEGYFSQVTEAYNTLSDPERRRAYDEERTSGVTQRAGETQDTRYLARQNYLRARALIDKGRRTDAVQYLTNAIQLDGACAAYHLELGRLLGGNPRRRDEAEALLIRANELDPAEVEGYLALGELYAKMGRADDAKRLFREVLSWEPGHIQATAQLKALGGKKGGLFGG